MAEKDQQIAELQGQLQEQNRKLEKQTKCLQEQGKQTKEWLQTQIIGVQEKLEKKSTERQRETANQISGMQKHLETQLTGFQGWINGKVADLATLLQAGGIKGLLQRFKQIPSSVLTVAGFRLPFEFTLTKFSLCKTRGGSGSWYSDPFYSHPGGYKFLLNIDTNGNGVAHGTHITAWLRAQRGEHDDKLSWPILVTAHLQLLNQRGDHGHVVASLNTGSNKGDTLYKEIACKYIAHSELGYNAAKDAQYLKDDRLHFRLYLKVTP